MKRKWLAALLAALFVCSRAASAEEPLGVSVFDVKQEKVVRAMPLEPELKRAVLDLLQSAPAVYGGLSMNPRSGLVVHVAFPEPVRVPHPFYKGRIREVYLFLERDVEPRALLFWEQGRPTVAVLHGDSRRFIERNGLGPPGG